MMPNERLIVESNGMLQPLIVMQYINSFVVSVVMKMLRIESRQTVVALTKVVLIMADYSHIHSELQNADNDGHKHTHQHGHHGTP
jgi:hypothetical protein